MLAVGCKYITQSVIVIAYRVTLIAGLVAYVKARLINDFLNIEYLLHQ